MSTEADEGRGVAEPDPALAATIEPESKAAEKGTLATVLESTATEDGPPRGRARTSSPPGDRGLVGRQLAHYQLEEEIGRGGMGVVYRARDLALDRMVAIKVLSDEFVGPDEHRARFYREARAQARIHHPNVCHIYYVGEEHDCLFFAMELVDGQSVSELVEEHGKLVPARALDLVRQAALGLREAQRHGIVHRDIKPSNLMIDRHGVVKVMDFGIAKQTDQLIDEAGNASATVEQTTVAGTPLFAAPEQLLGEAIDHRADIYALGATLHQLLTGSAPFLADSAEKLTQLHQTESRPQFERSVLGQRDLVLLNELTDRMMAKKPADRFEGYDQLLERIEFAEPSSSRPAGFGIRAAAMAVDGVFVAIASNLAGLSIPDEDVGLLFLLLLPVYNILLLGRFGKTLGRWLLGIEVTRAGAASGIGFEAAARRTLWQLGPLVLCAWASALAANLMLAPVEAVFDVGVGAAVLLNTVHVAFASFRSSAARTFWDRQAGTQVRYLRVRGVGASDSE